MRRASGLAIIALMTLSAAGGAQRDSLGARVRGTVFDSLHDRPLGNAFVGVIGSGRHAVTDSRGRFELDSVREGTYTVVVHHPLLDSIGLSGLSMNLVLSASAEARLATPSFATLWRRACGERAISKDTGFVYGTVRDVATNKPISDALVSVVWVDTLRQSSPVNLAERDADAEKAAHKVLPRKNAAIIPFDLAPASPIPKDDREVLKIIMLRLQGYSDSTGTYRVCGVPQHATAVQAVARASDLVSDSAEVRPELRAFRRDFRMPLTGGVHGTVLSGRVTDRQGAPVPFAHVVVRGAGESRTDDSGRFVLRGVIPGTRVIEVHFIGMHPHHTTVDVSVGDSTAVSIVVDRVPMLGAMNARAAGLGRVLAAEFDARRHVGVGWIVDSMTIRSFPSVEAVMRSIPSLTVTRKGLDIAATIPDGRGGQCEPAFYMDGLAANIGHLFDLSTKEAVALEAYVDPITTPASFIPMGTDRKCGTILVWTRYGFKNR